MKEFSFKNKSVKKIADTITPIGVYLNIRDVYADTVLLESSEYQHQENSRSFICFDPLITIKVKDKTLFVFYKNELIFEEKVNTNLASILHEIISKITVENNPYAGFYGHFNYDAVTYFETIELTNTNNELDEVPDVHLKFYRFNVVFNHFHQHLELYENSIDETFQLDAVSSKVFSIKEKNYAFKAIEKECASIADEAFIKLAEKAIEHTQMGNVFQLVLSNRFYQKFQGDELNVYRALRSINPSPYLFYFDFGSYKLMGSSPEAQLVVKNNMAEIHPIAGTYKRTGNDKKDLELAQQLLNDEKETAEHNMLVDLARNDLSKYCNEVFVDTFKSIQLFSHVIHIVSKVKGKIKGSALAVFGASFPAGTLTGAPKYKAMQLIDKYEKNKRSFYGGAVGYLGLNNEINMAITIRAILSIKNTLIYQAGAGIVNRSQPKKELEEIKNKTNALRQAIKNAEKF